VNGIETGKEGVTMKRWIVAAALVLVVALGSYALFAQPPAGAPQRGMGGGMMGRGMMPEGGMMGAGACPACGAMCDGMMRESVTATSDGGVVVAVAGKLMKYDAALKKVSEADIDIDWAAVHQRAQQMMQNCPMAQQMQQRMQQQQGRTSAQNE